MKINSKLLRTLTIAGALAITCSYTSLADASGGCGRGFHRDMWGRCIMNRPGPGMIVPIHRHPVKRCWRNHWGQIRCVR